MLFCVCVCVTLFMCVQMFKCMFKCSNIWVYACPGACAEVVGQPQVLVLTFHLVNEVSLGQCCVCQENKQAGL